MNQFIIDLYIDFIILKTIALAIPTAYYIFAVIIKISSNLTL